MPISDFRIGGLVYLDDSSEPRYEITGEFPSGGTANVFLAKDLNLNRRVVIKLFRNSQDWQYYLERECEGLSFMYEQCPESAITIIDKALKQKFVVLQYGESDLWHEGIKETPLPLVEVHKIIRILASKLACAHKNGLVHRDLKLNNVFFLHSGKPTTIRLGDFGSSKVVGSERASASKRRPVSCMYTAPEDLSGAADGSEPTLDVFSIGSDALFSHGGRAGHSPARE